MDEIDHDDERDNINRRKSKFPKCNFCGMFSQQQDIGLKCNFCGRGVIR